MSVNPKSVISAISPEQNGEIERKTVKLKTIDSSMKSELGKIKWQTKKKVQQNIAKCVR